MSLIVLTCLSCVYSSYSASFHTTTSFFSSSSQTINERQIRVDFSRTEAPHTPTPGFYNGKPIEEVRRERGTGSGDRYRSRSDHHHDSQRRSYRPASSSDIDGDRRYVPSRNRSRSRSNSRERNRQGKFRSDQRQNDYRPRHRSISRDRSKRNN